MTERKHRKMWGGFSEGVLDIRKVDSGFGGWGNNSLTLQPAIFLTRTEARAEYEDVRPVEVRELIRGETR